MKSSHPFFQKEQILSNLGVAIESVASNKLRSFLTALGIIFGVAAVITMLSIGKGAEKEIMDQMELVGVNNISIDAFTEQDEGDVASNEGSGVEIEKKSFSPGLTIADAQNIANIVPGIQYISPEIIMDVKVIRKGMWRTSQMIGVTNDFFVLLNFNLEYGRWFSQEQLEKGLPVCIIGQDIKRKFFDEENPIGKSIKLNNQWLRVVGIIEEKGISKKVKEHNDLGIRDYNMDVYIPIQTMLIRYTNRSRINSDDIKVQEQNDSETAGNYHQLDKMVIKIESGYDLNEVADIVSRILKRRHFEVIDYKITIPELLLKQQQKAKQVFALVLGAIAGISLLVGGIGIMNIMLASVMERIKEIGLRIALGAKQIDIVQQFLLEAVTISISGGFIGVFLGWIMSVLISKFSEITTIITFSSIVLAFGVAVSIGLIFGIMPAKKASKQNPINSLRHE